LTYLTLVNFFFSSRRRHTRFSRDWSSDVCSSDLKKNAVYNYKGNVFCYCPVTGVCREMPGGGFEKDRGTLKKICPARRYGIKCRSEERRVGKEWRSRGSAER